MRLKPKYICIFFAAILLLVGIGFFLPPPPSTTASNTALTPNIPAGIDDDPVLSIVYQGVRYTNIAIFARLPKDAECIGQISEVADPPVKELSCSDGAVGDNLYRYEEDGEFYLARQLPFPDDYPPQDSKDRIYGQRIYMASMVGPCKEILVNTASSGG